MYIAVCPSKKAVMTAGVSSEAGWSQDCKPQTASILYLVTRGLGSEAGWSQDCKFRHALEGSASLYYIAYEGQDTHLAIDLHVHGNL